MVVPVLAAAVACGGASSPKTGDAGFVKDGTVTTAITDDPGNLDPHVTASGQTLAFDSFLYDTLLHSTPDGKTVSGLAEKWAFTPTSATLTIRDGVTCSNGKPLTADDVALNFKRLQDPKVKSPLVGSLLGGADFKVAADSAARTVTLNLSKPFTDLEQNLTGYPQIVCAASLAAPAGLARGAIGGGAGTGPFVLSQASPNSQYILTRRDGYTWGPDGATTAEPGFPAKLVVKVVKDESTAANLLLTGALDVAGFQQVDRKRVAAAPGLTSQTIPTNDLILFFNEHHARPGTETAVRQALSLSLDREAFIKAATGGYGTKSNSLLMPGSPCSEPPAKVPATDIEKAKSLLDAAGWKAGANGTRSKNGKPLTIVVLAGGEAVRAEFLQDAWKPLGVNVTVNNAPSADAVGILFGAGNWDVVTLDFSNRLPSAYVSFFTGAAVPEGGNFTFTKNADYERLTAQARLQVPPQSCALWSQAEQSLVDRADEVPIGYITTQWFGRNVRFEAEDANTFYPTSIRVAKKK
jgi:peptide/nickel transport system substrate-binding protein